MEIIPHDLRKNPLELVKVTQDANVLKETAEWITGKRYVTLLGWQYQRKTA